MTESEAADNPASGNAGADTTIAATVAAEPVPAVKVPTLLDWLLEGARTLVFFRPRWERVHTSPVALASLVVLEMLVSIFLSRFYIEGEANFNWRAGLTGWSAFALTAWACYALRPNAAHRADAAVAPGAASLLAMITAQGACLSLLTGLAYIALMRADVMDNAAPWIQWSAWVTPLLWGVCATLTLLMRTGDRELSQRVQAVYAIVMACALTFYFSPSSSFWTEKPAASESDYEPLRISQETVENQAPLLGEKLDALAPQRPGIADMYTITYAPYEGEEVFRRESRMVSEVMAKRFDAAGRGVQMLNHREHLDDMPWATPLNLQRAIDGVANTMDKDEDVLFIYLTSHGASDGELATNFWPMEVAPVIPADLKKWLDDAGIRHRVISISACYSGSWIKPLADDDTLVMTASDAEHTSYGCGKKSDLTFFGRAMFDEQIRTQTRNFEQAHVAARKVIDKREKEAGKSDGYSNPQIKVGAKIGPYLEKMRARLGG
jgi:hypothetical protein